MRGLRRRSAVIGLVFCLGAAGLPPAGAYRFLHHRSSGPFLHHGEEGKLRWNRAVWGPGTEMKVAVPDDPNWARFEAIDGMEDVRRLVSEAMAQWSGLRTADIRWVLADPSEAGEAAVSVVVGLDAGAAGTALVAQRYGKDRPEIERCEVAVHFGVADVEFKELRDIVAHELGHCLGLAHHAPYPNAFIFPFQPERQWNSLWGDGEAAVRCGETAG